MVFCFEINIFEKFFREYHQTDQIVNSLNPDKVWRFVGPDLGTNCLQML